MCSDNAKFWKLNLSLSNIPNEDFKEIMKDIVKAIENESRNIKVEVGVAEEDPDGERIEHPSLSGGDGSGGG